MISNLHKVIKISQCSSPKDKKALVVRIFVAHKIKLILPVVAIIRYFTILHCWKGEIYGHRYETFPDGGIM